MSWGTELWDKYDDLCSFTGSGIDFLDKFVAEFVKERAKVEKEYAKDLRTLVKKYAIKGAKDRPGGRNDKEAEFTHLTAYKEMLKEVGYQAGQHEVLADSFAKDVYRRLHEQSKQLKEARRRNAKEAEKLAGELAGALKSMQLSKEKFRKAFEDNAKAGAAYEKANHDGSVSRNEVEKLRASAASKTSVCESVKHTYADQLVKANAFRQHYFHEKLPAVLDELQGLEARRIELIRDGILLCVSKEREVLPIVSKCHDSIQAAMMSVDPDHDSGLIVERFKSGDVPPGDFNFEDMHDPEAMLSQDALASNRATNYNLYPKKRELERQMAGLEADLARARKELKSIGQMMVTYQNQPKYGSAKQLQAEVVALQSRIAEMEGGLTSLKAEHACVEKRLDDLRLRSPMHAAAAGGRLNRGGSTNSSSGGSSIASSIAEKHRGPRLPANDYDDEFDLPAPAHPAEASEASPASDTLSSLSSPSVASSSSSSGSTDGLRRCVALYAYNSPNMEESNIPMVEGEEFVVVDDDCDGWTRVRRAMPNHPMGDEGFVPTTWIRML